MTTADRHRAPPARRNRPSRARRTTTPRRPSRSAVRRLRFLGETPAALEEIWFDARHAENLDVESINESMHLFYRQNLGFWIARVEDRVSVAHCPDFAPPDGPFKPGAPLGHVERISWSNADTVEEYSRNWFDPAAVAYVARWV
jgi:GntR family transcriptional regulator